MSNKRMNHVFNEMVVKAGRGIDTAELQFINGGVSATFFCTQQAIHAAHAINNHNRMMEEIAELRKGLEIMIEQFESDHNCEYEYNIIRWNKDLLAKLNQEGEE